MAIRQQQLRRGRKTASAAEGTTLDASCGSANGQTPFEKFVATAARRREANVKRNRALSDAQRYVDIDIDQILARDECLSQYEKDAKLMRDPQLFFKWTPLYPHPLPTSYESFHNKRELRRIAVLSPEDRVFAAAAGGRSWIVEELFAQGCPVDCKQGSGFTPLHVAATRNDVETARVLLNMNVDVNATTSSGVTPLLCAIGGAGGADGECASFLRASGGMECLVKDIIAPGSILDVPIRRPQRVIDSKADGCGRMVYTGQF